MTSSLLAFLLATTTLAFLYGAFRRLSGSRVQALLLTFVAAELLAVVQIEALSLFGAYRPWPVAGCWGVAATLAFALRRWAPRRQASRILLGRWELLLCGACGALLLGTLATGLLGAPNTWDSLSYHLPRAMHWLQNGSIGHYPTSIGRQLKMPPLAEILFSQSILVVAGERLVNLVQWSAYAATGAAIHALARGAGLSGLAGWSGTLIFLSVPMAVLQASGPKNDLVLCANMAASAVFFQIGVRRLRWPWIAAGAAALGLAVLTKGTALVFGAVGATLLLGAVVRRHGARRGLAVACVLAVGIGAVNAGHWWRNVRQFGSPLGPAREGLGYEYVNQRIDAGVVASNLLRNVAIHLETPSLGLNRAIETWVGVAHERLGIAQDDPETTWPDAELRLARFPSRDENRSGNPLHWLAIVAALATSPWLLRGAPHARAARLLAVGLLAGAFAFCLLFQWQEWHSRLHLPLFAAGSLLLVLVGWRWRRSMAVAALLLAVAAGPALLANDARPLVGAKNVRRQTRAENLLQWHGRDAGRLARRLAELDVGELGLRLRGNDPEYLIWAIARSAAPRARLHHVAAFHRVPSYVVPELDAVVGYGDWPRKDRVRIDGRAYRVDCRCGVFTLWRPVASPAETTSRRGRGAPSRASSDGSRNRGR